MMATSDLLMIIGIAGLGTYLTRLLPMLLAGRPRKKPMPHALRKALDAIGPAAIVALLMTAFWAELTPAPSIRAAMPLLAGIVGVVLGKRLFGSIAAATVAGVAAYGMMLWALSAGLSP